MLQDELVVGQEQDAQGESAGLNVFIAAPMSGFDRPEDYEKAKRDIDKLTHSLQSMRKVSDVYFAGNGINSIANFTPNNMALVNDLTALAAADRFFFIYPKKVMTSAFVEVGFALGQNIRSHFFVKDKDHLPYLLKDCHEVSSKFPLVPRISISTYEDGEELARKAKDRLNDD